MESIQSTLKKWMKENRNFQQAYKELKEQIMNSRDVQAFIAEHPELQTTDIERQLMKLYEYDNQSKQCEKCPSLSECCNIIPGYAPKLSVQNRQIRIAYDRCPQKIKQDEQNRKKSFVQSLYMPKEILEASIEDIDFEDSERINAIMKIKELLDQLDQKKTITKGLYMYGPFGVGKTFLLGVLANEFAKREIQSMFIYMPEFVREMKSSIGNSTLNEKVDKFKQIPVLIFDDIGAEFQSAWFRDEVLGAILQYRMMEGLPVFFTSNYNLKELESILAAAGKGEMERLKAGRIIERIKQVSDPVALFGQNRRP
ncbi:primosomal protein DnaI [Salirhabdus salicampi]|uniref:primosomal protein DnaI n=1 Tax=Salirhabdus salicampi TaxID=476102 RepID=UPI0020C42DE9|nr:primosomal protein DnaI [Salirhabdus salicampi]MCP8617079.1 primosomal protein DnaI [Salirhabdus salicampi]